MEETLMNPHAFNIYDFLVHYYIIQAIISGVIARDKILDYVQTKMNWKDADRSRIDYAIGDLDQNGVLDNGCDDCQGDVIRGIHFEKTVEYLERVYRAIANMQTIIK